MGIAEPLAALATAGGTLVMLAGLAHAAASPREAGRHFARGVLLALEFFLAAGLLRLAETTGAMELATAAGIVAVRTLIGRTIRPLAGDRKDRAVQPRRRGGATGP